MKVERACIDATLNALKESEAEAALAAAKVLEAAAEVEYCKSEMDIASPPLSPAVSRQHTDEYINTHFNHQQDDKSENKVEVACTSQPQYTEALYTSQRMLQPVLAHILQHFQDPQTTHQSPHSNVKAFSPYSPHENNNLITGFKVFGDRLDHYMSWRSTFRNAIKGLNLKPRLTYQMAWQGVTSACFENQRSPCQQSSWSRQVMAMVG